MQSHTQTTFGQPATQPSDPLDLFIIGGGINGCAIARDAAGRGLNVALAEKGDLAQATSSKSTKLFHGGLRYLEYGEIKLVRSALQEREVLLKSMPHIAWPMRFVLPLSPDMRFDTTTPASRLISFFMPWTKGRRPSWMIRTGLWLYDILGKREILEGTKSLNLGTAPEGQPLSTDFKRAFEYSDVWVDDARLVSLLALDALELGAQIHVNTAVISARRENGMWRIDMGDQGTVFAHSLVNATGPWVTDVIKNVVSVTTTANLRRVRGSHIVTKKLYDHEKAYFLQGPDGRIIFLIPYENDFTLIGTTEAAQKDDPLAAQISDTERAYLLDFASSYLKQPVTQKDIVHEYAGVRALYEDGASSATAATREYVLNLNSDGAPLLNVFGGKITTHRRLAEDVLEKLAEHISIGPAWTKSAPLPGGDFPLNEHDQLSTDLQIQYPFVEKTHADRLVRLYGTRAKALFENLDDPTDMGQHFGADLYENEVRYLILQEFARKADDIIWRRTKLGLRLTKDQTTRLESWISENIHDLLPAANTSPAGVSNRIKSQGKA
ncbi:glycerol-3-phosphate dehydrogenase [Pacificibacter maritimus]|uniref:Glycerol-3-phosphate dehydrogenase n=1 Tax=Pacificibacter maritimus TaxID=762213 RepID=A0A3N4VFM0_9RHOB|nr:glycerol-3-phosphate dehydrogenase [Pacificibacter maritimus]RPE71724.1 glycerol-3-phosphate dehydrogenase [Pacificibacter maritimus]